ncbi:MAG: hypothetical protein H6846_02120 [Hyphomonas sp.]|nr:hypothetical protein [Hyphomonas sp.]MCB9960907.1 hypothetical protein [Hyphomonas sp.]
MSEDFPISRAAWRWALGLAGLILASAVVWSLADGRFGHPGPDGDDVMRLVQIRDFLAGQGWFDMHQYRLGPEGGTLMHWSRIPDVPILALYAVFDLFLSSDTALMWAISVWPPLSLLIVLAGLILGARHLGNGTVLVFTMIVALPVFLAHFRFLSGSIDHHNLQLGLLAVAIGASLDPLRRAPRLALSGIMLGLSVAIGAETYPFIGVLCAFHALDWAWTGTAARKGTVAFGLAFAGTIAVSFFATVAPSQWGAVYCDTLSIVSLCGGVIGGAGLALGAYLLPERNRNARFAVLAGIALVCAILFVFGAPQCLENPLDALPEDVRTLWLGNVVEARPLLAPAEDRWRFAAYALGTSVVGLTISLLAIAKGRQVRAHLLFAALLGIAVLLVLYQIRFYAFAHLIAVLPTALWCAHVFAEGRQGRGSQVAYLLALALSNPMLWMMPALALEPVVPPEPDAMAGCLTPQMVRLLNDVPPGTIVAGANLGGQILADTPQRVLSGNYHRDAAGIGDALAAFSAPPSEAGTLLREAGADYVLYCPGVPEDKILSKLHPDGLLAGLANGQVPGWLQPLGPEAGEGRLYRLSPRD